MSTRPFLILCVLVCIIPICSGLTNQEIYANYVQSGDTFFNQSQFSIAKEQYYYASSMRNNLYLFNPPISEVWYKIGLCDFKLGTYEDAISSYGVAINRMPSPSLKSKIYLAKGEALVYYNECDRADVCHEAKLAFTEAGMSSQAAEEKITETIVAMKSRDARIQTLTLTPTPTNQIQLPASTVTISNPAMVTTAEVSTSQNPIKGGESGIEYSSILIVVLILLGISAAGIFLYKRTQKSNSFDAGKQTWERDKYPETVEMQKQKTRIIPHDIFISYASHEKPIADAVCAALEAKKIRCWIAPRDVTPGINYQEALVDAIDSSRIMVLIFSSHSNKSPHVIRELTRAMSKNVMIIPFRVEDVQPSKSVEFIISIPHWLDAITPPIEKHIDILVTIVQKNLDLS
jgi:tetratricopeptide (TPR) repeat protein